MTLSQGFFEVGRRYRYVDVWEYLPSGWKPIYVSPQSRVVLLDEGQARTELGTAKTNYFAYGRIFRLWTWTGSAWDLTEQR